jgi:hypothetical protein
VTYGTSGTEYEGNLELPAVGDVVEDTTYGTNGTELTGTFVVPAVADVQENVVYGEPDYTPVAPPIAQGTYYSTPGQSYNSTTLSWPGQTYAEGTVIFQGDASKLEPSGIIWHPRLNKFVFVDDGNYGASTPARLYMCDLDGSNLKKVKLTSSWQDTEDICYADPDSDYLYVAREQLRYIEEYKISDFDAAADDAVINYTRQFNVSSIVPLDGTNGMEALTFVPDEGSDEGGYFYCGCQWNHKIYIVELSIVTGGTSVTHKTVAPFNSPWDNYMTGTYYDLSCLNWDTRYNVLWAVYDYRIERLVAFDKYGTQVLVDFRLPVVPWWPATTETNIEGFAWTDTNLVAFAVDNGTSNYGQVFTVNFINPPIPGEFTGTLAVPDEADVEESVGYGAGGTEYTGAFVVPDEDDVRATTEYGADAEFTGNATFPAEGDVQYGVQYGTSGTEYTGAFQVPLESDVQAGVQYGYDYEYQGTYVVPLESEVLDGVGYGDDSTEYEGTVTLPAEADVKTGVEYGADGTEYTGTYSAASARIIGG